MPHVFSGIKDEKVVTVKVDDKDVDIKLVKLYKNRNNQLGRYR